MYNHIFIGKFDQIYVECSSLNSKAADFDYNICAVIELLFPRYCNQRLRHMRYLGLLPAALIRPLPDSGAADAATRIATHLHAARMPQAPSEGPFHTREFPQLRHRAEPLPLTHTYTQTHVKWLPS
ncbi:uncharacterized protein LOC108093522 [Drosophila ficusphila]|uniref:uncharacterized protein LOC108093522 n=1 Tax=Drosophila ficusphila TaxID=30025 RepID=UPI0007E81491|nr:uncharacterized protein LOC108093522 [Drosophila ficusphila]